MRKFLIPIFSIVFCLLLSFLLFCSKSSDVSADVTYTQMTPEQAYAFYGDRIACTYYNGTTYVNSYLVPSSSRRVYYRASTSSYGENIPSWLDYQTTMQYVYYYCPASDYSNNPSYLGVDIQPNVHFSDCTDFRFAAFAYCGNNNVPNTSAGYSDSFIYVNNLRFSNANNVSAAGWYPAIEMTRIGASGSWYCLGVWADYHSDVISNANLMRIGFNGARTDGGEIGIYLSLPQYNSGASPESGIVTTATNISQDIAVNVTVDVDLSPLQTDIQALGSQVGGVASDVAGVKHDVQGIVTDVSAIASLLAGGDETYINMDLSPIDTLPTLNYDQFIDTAAAVMDEIPSGIAASASLWAVLGELLQTDVVWIWLVPLCMFLSLAAFLLYRG